MKRLSLILLLLTMLLTNQANAALQTFVSIPPQKWLVDRIGGDLVITSILVEKGQDPHTFEPTPQTMSRLVSASLWLTLDMEFEKELTARVSRTAPKLRIVDTTSGITKIRMVGPENEHHHGHEVIHDTAQSRHGEHGSDHHRPEINHTIPHNHHDHAGGYDPHVWLSPVNLIIMATAVEQALAEADPVNSASYEQNRKQVEEELTQLHQDLARILAPHKGASFYVFHPSFGYFANTYELKQYAVEVEGKTPTPRQLSRLISRAKKEGVKVIFVQPQFDSSSGQVIAQAIHGEVVPLNPLAEDVAANLRLIAERINSALSP